MSGPRVIFYSTKTQCSLPPATFAIGLFLFALPSDFPFQGTDLFKSRRNNLAAWKSLDIFGCILVLGGSLLLSTSLLETSTHYSWAYGGTIALTVLSVICWLGFFAWEWFASCGLGKFSPLLPWSLISNRPFMGMLLYGFNPLVIALADK
jgi:hypothetical protein